MHPYYLVRGYQELRVKQAENIRLGEYIGGYLTLTPLPTAPSFVPFDIGHHKEQVSCNF